jgi:uncharacterized protein YndB with AHSA1/START domain
MNDISDAASTRDILVEEVFPHPPSSVWKALTTGEIIARWLMEPKGFEPVAGNRFTFQTKAGGAWDGVIHCEVLEVIPDRRFVYAWKGGHEANSGYGAPLDTIVTFTLTPEGEGTRLRLVHSGFVLPRNDSAFTGMGEGWKKVVHELQSAASGEL